MLDFLINNMFVLFGGRVFQQMIDISMGTNVCSTTRQFVSTCI
jgi:hypothetical protein